MTDPKRSLLVLGAVTMVTMALVGLFTVATAAESRGVGTIKIEKGIRIADGGTPGLYEFGRKDLRIYYNNTTIGFATAESRNGRKWKNAQSTGIRVDGAITADASVIFWDGALRLYFKVAPLDDQDSHQVWRATATDEEGIGWDVDGRVYKRTGSPCFDWTSVPHAVVTHDNRVRLYFVCSKNETQVASAISDDGTKFTFEQIVVPGAVDPYVVREGDGYRMFHSGREPGGQNSVFNTISSTTSLDGLSWTESEELVDASDFDVQAAIDPAAYQYRDGRYRVYIPTAVDLQGGQGFNIYSIRFVPSDFNDNPAPAGSPGPR